MKLHILAFGAAADIMGGRKVELNVADSVTTVGLLKAALTKEYPDITRLTSFLIAVNARYAQDKTRISGNDEIAVIPPISGG